MFGLVDNWEINNEVGISWNFYIADAQSMNEEELDAEIQVEIFKQVVIEDNIFDIVIDSYLI